MSDTTSTNTDEGTHTRYHHGNLKQALLEGFLTLLENSSPEQISMRKLASHVGVAPTAVYNHFKNKEELSVAVKILCLNHFATYLDKNSLTHETPRVRIQELGKAYFNYSIEHTQYFRLIIGTQVPEHLVTEELINAGMRAEAALRSSVIALLEQNDIPITQHNEGLGALACWSLAHGISALSEMKVNTAACTSGTWPPEFLLSTPEQVHSSFDALTEVLVAGILHATKKA